MTWKNIKKKIEKRDLTLGFELYYNEQADPLKRHFFRAWVTTEKNKKKGLTKKKQDVNIYLADALKTVRQKNKNEPWKLDN